MCPCAHTSSHLLHMLIYPIYPLKGVKMGPQKGPKMVHFRTPHSTISNVPFQLHHFGDPLRSMNIDAQKDPF